MKEKGEVLQGLNVKYWEGEKGLKWNKKVEQKG